MRTVKIVTLAFVLAVLVVPPIAKATVDRAICGPGGSVVGNFDYFPPGLWDGTSTEPAHGGFICFLDGQTFLVPPMDKPVTGAVVTW